MSCRLWCRSRMCWSADPRFAPRKYTKIGIPVWKVVMPVILQPSVIRLGIFWNMLKCRMLPGALGIPLAELRRAMAKIPRTRDVVAYCRGPYCVLAVDAVRLMRSRGLRAFSLDASIQDWRARGLPVATGNERGRRMAAGRRAR